ncbi:hypothetical protein L1887_43913 [Cichorium endivia]|nr:hypothetical protein L1887_43913 [Cichorium endivia]
MWYLLATSLAALSLNRSLAYLMLGLTAFLGWKQSILDAPALLVIASIVVGWSVVEWLRNKNNKYTYLVEGLCVAIAVALVLHVIPGFHNPKVLDAVVVGPQSIPFSMYFNMDKAVVPFFLITCMPTLFVAKPLYKAGKVGWGILILAIPALLLLAVALGGLRIEPHAPEWFAQFALANIFFVSLAEEALFRGYLQQRLSRIIHPVVALLIASVIFGLMHYSGGLLLIIFASLSGIIYGLAWMWSGRLKDVFMNSRLLSCFSLALLSSSLFLSTQAVAADNNEGIVVYNAQHENLVKSWVDGFTKDTGIKVTLRNGDDSELGNQLVQEGSASPADVFLTENSPSMVLVDNANLFAPLDADTLKQVPAEYRPAHGRWIGIAARSTVFVYNPAKLSEQQLPKSLMDLAKPEWKGRWAASPSGADFQAIVSAMLALKGEKATLEWLKAMKANFVAYKGNSTVMKAVNAGQIDGGVIYHYYRFVDQSKTGENSKNTQLYYFKHQDPGAFVSLSGGGVLASSKHKAQAQAFIKYITGKEGQESLRTNNAFEYAVGVNAASNPKLVPLKDLDAPKVEPSTLNSKKVIELMTQAGLL